MSMPPKLDLGNRPSIRWKPPLHIILGHPAAQAIFRQYAPEFLENPMLEYVKDEPITALLAYGESMRPLFEQVLTAMNQADKR